MKVVLHRSSGPKVGRVSSTPTFPGRLVRPSRAAGPFFGRRLPLHRSAEHRAGHVSAPGSDNGSTAAADGTASDAPGFDSAEFSRELITMYKAMKAVKQEASSEALGEAPLPMQPLAFSGSVNGGAPQAAVSSLAPVRKLQRTMSGRELPPVWADACLSPAALYDTVGEMGASKVRQPLFKTLVLSMLAGCYTSFGAALALTVGFNCPGLAATDPGLVGAVKGLYGLPMGAIMAILTGAELFTGNTGLWASAVYQRHVTPLAALRTGATAYLGNLLGALTMVVLVYHSGVFTGATAPAAVATAKVSLSTVEAFFRGVLCCWLLNLGVWQAAAATSVVGKTIGLLVPLSAFVACGFEHSIANMFMIPLGILCGAPVSFSEFLIHNLLPVTLGNVVGGAVCVAGTYALAWTGVKGLFLGRR